MQRDRAVINDGASHQNGNHCQKSHPFAHERQQRSDSLEQANGWAAHWPKSQQESRLELAEKGECILEWPGRRKAVSMKQTHHNPWARTHNIPLCLTARHTRHPKTGNSAIAFKKKEGHLAETDPSLRDLM
jgi:hypothetical protein